MADDRRQLRVAERRDHPGTGLWVALDLDVLVDIERAGFVDDRRRGADLADVVQQRRRLDPLNCPRGEAELGGDRGGKGSHTARVAVGPRVAFLESLHEPAQLGPGIAVS